MSIPLLEKPRFFDLRPQELDAQLARLGWPAFRGKQVRDWVYNKHVTNPRLMTNLPAEQREALADAMTFSSAMISRQQSSNDGTQKLLLTWPPFPGSGQPGATAETVMIPDGDRRTACVSSQVGCPVGCRFCASGIDGVKGNLSAGQIVEQVFILNRGEGARGEEARRHEGTKARSEGEGKEGKSEEEIAAPPSSPSSLSSTTSCLRASVPSCLSSSASLPSCLPPHITNVVFMGMGEPLANYANVMRAVRILHDPQCLNLGARRITISTVGVPAKMRELAHEALPINLAISLHAPNEPLRKKLIPWAEHFALAEILDAARYYFERTGREVTLEYILLAGVNDRPEHARELAAVCATLRANVNLIRYNEVASLPFKRPRSHDVMAFQEILRRAGVNAHIRKSRGRDIDAACGQLRRKEQRGSAT